MSDNHPLTRLLRERLAEGTGVPIGSVIVDVVWLAVIEGVLTSGQRLPTAREIAISLGVSPRTVERAYEELEARGVVANRLGEGTSVSLHPSDEAERDRHRQLAELCREAFDRATALGFGVDDLISSLSEYRYLDRARSSELNP